MDTPMKTATGTGSARAKRLPERRRMANVRRKGAAMLAVLIAFAIAWRADRKAVTALEYGLIAGVLGVIIICAFTDLGTQLEAEFIAIEALMGG